MNLDQAFQTFLDESRELLVEMEGILLELESSAADPELLSALFRCVHTIKGSAGMFGLDHVVEFTHVVENVLDRLRADEIRLDAKLARLLLGCRDHIGILVELIEPIVDEALRAVQTNLLAELAEYQMPSGGTQLARTEDVGSRSEGDGVWHISLRFNEDVLRHGMDPLGFVRYLSTMGELVQVTTIPDALPTLDTLDPESCYLGFEIDLRTETDRQTIEDVFEFVRELCQLRILPPRSSLEDYIELIRDLPEDLDRLGDLLVASGVLARADLEKELHRQSEQPTHEQRRIGEVLVEHGKVHPDLVGAALNKQEQVRERKAKTVQHLRVQAEKLDRLINLVGELVIASAAVALNASTSGDAATRESAAAMSLLVEDIRDSSLQLRMVPIGDTFQRFQRVVRDVSADLGKNIELVISGADTELDKTVVEKIGDPLTHLVRNACDHGIESAEERTALGKPAQGTLSLNAYHESGAIVIEVADDGGGLDRDRILAKAVERELVAADAALSDQEVFNLIFEPGFSTADQVTNLSGRGVGMDVVRRNIEALRGAVDVESTPGTGTTLRIRLPLTLAIIDGFLSAVGDSVYVVPLEMVEECVEFPEQQQRETDGRNFVNLRGEVLPLVRLREYFRVNAEKARRQNILVVNYGGQKTGLVVDELLGEHQTVIKPLGTIFERVEGLSGSTILGSGRVALILDVPSLVQMAMREENRHADGSRTTAMAMT